MRLDEAAYIIAIHNQYFYFVSKVEERRRRRRCKSTNTKQERGREEKSDEETGESSFTPLTSGTFLLLYFSPISFVFAGTPHSSKAL